MTDSQEFDQAIERLLADQSPRSHASRLASDEQRMVRMAQILRGSNSASASPQFVEELRDRLTPARRVTRRAAFLAGLGSLAAGIAAGIGLDHIGATGQKRIDAQPLVGSHGRWVAVARADAVAHGAVHRFTAGAVQGFIINNHGNYRALSSICTHMGCGLNFNQPEQTLVCPCHGAEFDLNGQGRYGARGYPIQLPPLPAVDVRVNGPNLEVWAV